MRRALILVLLLIGMQLILPLGRDVPGAGALLTLGFLMLAAYTVGEIVAAWGLPKLLGYLVAGIIFGPSVLGTATLGLMLGMSIGERTSFASLGTVAVLALCPIGITWFVLAERRAAHPLVPLPYFARRNFAGPLAGYFFAHIAYMGAFVVTPILLDDVFAGRMGAGPVAEGDAHALGQWLDRVQAPHGVVRDEAAVERGQAVFMAAEVGCTSCHVGPLYTNNTLADVGLGAVKVPSLVGVGGRAPYMHDGCAATLRDRFGACGGGDTHGHTSQLTPGSVVSLQSVAVSHSCVQ